MKLIISTVGEYIIVLIIVVAFISVGKNVMSTGDSQVTYYESGNINMLDSELVGASILKYREPRFYGFYEIDNSGETSKTGNTLKEHKYSYLNTSNKENTLANMFNMYTALHNLYLEDYDSELNRKDIGRDSNGKLLSSQMGNLYNLGNEATSNSIINSNTRVYVTKLINDEDLAYREKILNYNDIENENELLLGRLITTGSESNYYSTTLNWSNYDINTGILTTNSKAKNTLCSFNSESTNAFSSYIYKKDISYAIVKDSSDNVTNAYKVVVSASQDAGAKQNIIEVKCNDNASLSFKWVIKYDGDVVKVYNADDLTKDLDEDTIMKKLDNYKLSLNDSVKFKAVMSGDWKANYGTNNLSQIVANNSYKYRITYQYKSPYTGFKAEQSYIIVVES